jgi:hypothetical protein
MNRLAKQFTYKRTYCSKAGAFNQRLRAAAEQGARSSDLQGGDSEVYKILEEMTSRHVQFDEDTNKILRDIGNGAYDPLTVRSRARAAWFDAEREKFEKAHPSSFQKENRS